MSSTSTCQVLIAGAGPSGLVLALILAKNGINVRIIEKDRHPQVGQRGPGMQPRSLELFHLLGTLPDIQGGGTTLKPLRIYKMPEGRELLQTINRMGKNENTPNLPYANPLLLGQSHHGQILRSHLATHDIHVEFGTELISFSQDDERVTAQVVVRNDDAESEGVIHADYLVSTEGAKSVVRRQLGLTFLGETRDGSRMLIADVYIKGLEFDYSHQWGDWGSAGVHIFPTEFDGLFTMTLTGKDFNPSDYIYDRERLLEYVYNTTNRWDLEFGEIKWITDWRLEPNIRMVNKFGEGRAYLVGDAAHVHSPTGGQGNNTGAQDAFNLGWKLALVLKKLSPRSLLETYDAERLPVVREMLSMTTQLLDKAVNFKAESTKANDSPFNRPKSLHQLGVNYRWSPVIVDEQEHDRDATASSAAYLDVDPAILFAGDRAPDASGLVLAGSGSVETRLFDLFKLDKHTALVFDPITEEAEKIIDALSVVHKDALQIVRIFSSEPLATENAADTITQTQTALNLVDRDGHARNGYPPVLSGYSVIIVRPDGMVGAVVKTTSGVERYLKKVFAL